MSKACRLVGYSRQQFYEIRRNYQVYGAEGLIDRLPGARGPHPNRVSEAIEQAVLAQVRLLERYSPEFRERHIETTHTGELPRRCGRRAK